MSIPTPFSWKCTKVVKQYSPKGQTYPHRFEHSQKRKRSALFESFGTANDILPRNCTVLIRSKRSCKQEMQWARSVWFHLRIESDTYQQQASSCNHGNRLQSPNVQHTNPEFFGPAKNRTRSYSITFYSISPFAIRSARSFKYTQRSIFSARSTSSSSFWSDNSCSFT